tara:strand:+ start:9130 stop:9375 length:246 start_codon:yes stop_codon:yes gene_type:complete
MAIRETFLKKYGVYEYVLFIVGLFISGRGVYDVIFLNLDALTWDAIAKIIALILFGALLIAAPKALVDIARNKFGSEPNKK